MEKRVDCARSFLDTSTSRLLENEMFRTIAEGDKSKDIARRLGISNKTVEKHGANLMNKLGPHSASSLTGFAVDKGLITSSGSER